MYVAWEGQARKREVMLLRVIPLTRWYQGGRWESRVLYTPQGREAAAGLALSLASGRWGWTGPRGTQQRLPGRGGAGPAGRREKREGDPGAGRSRRGVPAGPSMNSVGALLRPVTWVSTLCPGAA